VKRERKLIAEKGHSFSGYAGTVIPTTFRCHPSAQGCAPSVEVAAQADDELLAA
jgi:hypothetical protein